MSFTCFEPEYELRAIHSEVNGPAWWRLLQFDSKLNALTNFISGFEIDLEQIGSSKAKRFALMSTLGQAWVPAYVARKRPSQVDQQQSPAVLCACPG